MLPESLCHKVHQLKRRRVAQIPHVPVGVVQAGGGGAEVTVDRTVRNGGGGRGSVHRFFPVIRGFLFDVAPGVQVLLQGCPVLLCTLLSNLQTLLAVNMDQFWETGDTYQAWVKLLLPSEFDSKFSDC